MSKITERENFLLLMSGQKPHWVPNFGKVAAFVYSDILGRRYDPQSGYMIDPFGVEFTSTIDGPTVAHTKDSKPLMDDILDWKKYMPKIDLKSVDWAKDVHRALDSASCAYSTGAGKKTRMSFMLIQSATFGKKCNL